MSSTERQPVKYATEPDSKNSFEKWRGIGGFPLMGKGRDAIVEHFRELRGYCDVGKGSPSGCNRKK
jgi:hypothetical protein